MKRISLVLLLLVSMLIGAQAQITPTAAQPVATENPDAKYLAPLPMEDGKVYLLREVQLPAGADQEATFRRLQAWTDRCMQDSRISTSADIPTDQPLTIQRQVGQTITFSSSLLSLDQTQMEYLFTISLQGDRIVLKMSHIHYRYNGENTDRKMLRYSAEDHIADAVAINKKGTKLIYGYKKFRVSTIDLMDEYESSLKFAFLAE